MKEIGLKTRLKEKEYICIKTAQLILDNGVKTNNMDLDLKSGLMGLNTKDISKMDSRKDKAHSYGQMAVNIKDNSKTII